jgi:threonine dehydrogenase-like Zn-dependent dehydrogenase
LAASAPECTQCGSTLRVVPSRSYAASEVTLFDELSQTVATSISSVEAQQLGEKVAHALRGRSFDDCIETLSQRWPALLPLQLVTGGNLVAQHRVLHMLKTIFDALALARRSGFMSAVSVPEAKAGKRASRGVTRS